MFTIISEIINVCCSIIGFIRIEANIFKHASIVSPYQLIIMPKKSQGIATKVQNQSGIISKRETIEALTVSARTGKLKPSLRTISIASVLLLVPENYLHIPWY
jgi:hypothetical protein